MIKQYRILSDCLSELKKSRLPMLEKLKLQVQLIQAKRLLLHEEIAAKIDGVPVSEAEFAELQRSMQKACSQADVGAIDGISHHLSLLMGNLRGHLAVSARVSFIADISRGHRQSTFFELRTLRAS
jgi:hypothetical protein